MINMWKKKTPEKIEVYQFSELYCRKKEKIQEENHYEFIEFLNWVENVNKWKKKEDGKRLVDLWFNKYSNDAILWLFDKFVKFKENRSRWYTYEAILNEAKMVLKTDVYGENIVKPLFWYYGNYLKYLRKKEREASLANVVDVNLWGAKKITKQKKVEVADALKATGESMNGVEQEKKDGNVKIDEWAVNHYGGNDRDIVNEDGDVVPNPDHMHIPQEIVVEPIEEEDKEGKKLDEEKEDEENKPIFDETGQGIINFKEFRN